MHAMIGGLPGTPGAPVGPQSSRKSGSFCVEVRLNEILMFDGYDTLAGLQRRVGNVSQCIMGYGLGRPGSQHV